MAMQIAYHIDRSGLLQRFKSHLPSGMKRVLKEALRRHTLSRTLHQIASLPPGTIPSRRMLTSLRSAWGNEGWSGSPDYLEEVARRALATTGPILECGSGLTTILLGLLAGRRGIEVWSLEDRKEWQCHVSRILERYNVPGVTVSLSPLKEYANSTWYSLPSGMPERFTLVICDGPGVSYASRYGLVPVLGQRLVAGALILADDSLHMTEIIDRWLIAMPVELLTHGPRFSVLRVIPESNGH